MVPLSYHRIRSTISSWYNISACLGYTNQCLVSPIIMIIVISIHWCWRMYTQWSILLYWAFSWTLLRVIHFISLWQPHRNLQLNIISKAFSGTYHRLLVYINSYGSVRLTHFQDRLKRDGWNKFRTGVTETPVCKILRHITCINYCFMI